MRTKRLLALAMAGALVLAACGGDDSEGGGDTTAAPSDTTTAPAETTTTVAEPEAWAVNTDDCEDPDAANAPIEGDIKIGTAIPLSGGPAALFAPFGAGFEARFKLLEAEGGINGQKVVTVIKDDQYNPQQTVSAVEELITKDQVHLISGLIGTPGNAAVQADLNAQCIPQLFASTGADWGKVEEYPWTTGLLVPYPVESKVWVEFVKAQKPDAKRAALFYVKNEFGQAYAESFKIDAKEAGFELVAEETIEATDSGAPTNQMTNLVAAKPDMILAVPLGGQCIGFMNELGNAKAANPDFNPMVYVTATCASPVFFVPPGNGADGVYSSANLKDVNNPDNRANDPDVKAYLEAFASTGSTADPGGIAVAGWLAADATIAVLKAAAESPEGLTRASIINAARNLDYKPPLLRGDLRFKQSGPEDAYYAEGTQVVQWSAADKVFKDQGEVINVEGTTKFPGR